MDGGHLCLSGWLEVMEFLADTLFLFLWLIPGYRFA